MTGHFSLGAVAQWTMNWWPKKTAASLTRSTGPRLFTEWAVPFSLYFLTFNLIIGYTASNCFYANQNFLREKKASFEFTRCRVINCKWQGLSIQSYKSTFEILAYQERMNMQRILIKVTFVACACLCGLILGNYIFRVDFSVLSSPNIN